MSIIKKDYSVICDLNDENPDNNCWGCVNFLFPIGCMIGEEEEHVKVMEGELQSEIGKM